jgi:hypothetical protein
MIKKHFLTTVIIGVAVLFVSAGIYAKSTPDVIPLQDPAYKKHKKGVVKFEHKKHWGEYSKAYPDLYPNQCGECHHDKDNNPLTALKDGDEVQKCIECHKTASEMPKKKKQAMKKDVKAKKISKDALNSKILEYHAEALHENCKVCHKTYNKKYKPKKKAPTTCTKCHPKKKKK